MRRLNVNAVVSYDTDNLLHRHMQKVSTAYIPVWNQPPRPILNPTPLPSKSPLLLCVTPVALILAGTRRAVTCHSFAGSFGSSSVGSHRYQIRITVMKFVISISRPAPATSKLPRLARVDPRALPHDRSELCEAGVSYGSVNYVYVEEEIEMGKRERVREKESVRACA